MIAGPTGARLGGFMAGAGGIQDGTLDTWLSTGVAVTVRKCSPKLTARRPLGCPLIALQMSRISGARARPARLTQCAAQGRAPQSVAGFQQGDTCRAWSPLGGSS